MSLFRFMQCFNSTMVRLKDPDAFTKFDLATFQFHYGTIKSARFPSNCITYRHFNSTMVRLKAAWVKERFLDSSLFQFHYGTIKSTILDDDTASVLHFNSTMVRLKVILFSLSQPLLQFQFHYGTIKSTTKKPL